MAPATSPTARAAPPTSPTARPAPPPPPRWVFYTTEEESPLWPRCPRVWPRCPQRSPLRDGGPVGPVLLAATVAGYLCCTLVVLVEANREHGSERRVLDATIAFLVLNLVLACVGAVWWAKSTYRKRQAAAAVRRELLRAAAAPSAGDRERADAAIARHAAALAGGERSGACAICLGDLDDDEAPLAAARVTCGHAFHMECLRPWLAHCAREKRSLTCPTCRTPVCPAAAPDVEAGDVVPVNSESHSFVLPFACACLKDIVCH